MNNWTTADVMIFAAAVYIACLALLKLIAARREELIDQLDADITRERKQQQKS